MVLFALSALFLTLLWLLLCFRLSVHFHCIIFSSFPSPHFPSADPSPVFLSACQQVVIPLTAISSICFAFPLPLLHFDLFAFCPLFSPLQFFSLSALSFFPFCFPTVTLWPCSFPHPSSIHSWFLSTFFMWLSALLFTSSVHLSIHLFPCNFPSHPTATFPFHLSPKWVHSLVFGPLKYQGCSNLFLWHDFYLLSTCMEPSCPMPTCLFPSHRSSFPYFLLFMVSSPLHLYLCSHSPALSIIHSYLDIFFLILIL